MSQTKPPSNTLLPEVGDWWPFPSLVWGELAGNGNEVSPASPVTGDAILRTTLLSHAEMEALLESADTTEPDFSTGVFQEFAEALGAELDHYRGALIHAMQLETGFITSDCAEVVDGTIRFAHEFTKFASDDTLSPYVVDYLTESGPRIITPSEGPFGTVLAILPQNAFLILGVTCLLSALHGGNRVALRAPTQSARTAAILSRCVAATGLLAERISIVLAPARMLLDHAYRTELPLLIHYLGSSANGSSILSPAFESGKNVIIDGDGNTWVWVGPDFDTDEAVEIVTRGSLRYNGATCTSINGVVVHPDAYDSFVVAIESRWSRLRTGDPRDEGVDVGPALDARLAANCYQSVRTSMGRVISGGEPSGAYLAPQLVEDPDPASELVTHGVFGPVLWVTRGDEADFSSRWPTNRYPICAGVLSRGADAETWLRRLPGVARLSLNGDPSVEDIFEPWGGYGRSGTSPVCSWLRKYVRQVQVDRPK